MSETQKRIEQLTGYAGLRAQTPQEKSLIQSQVWMGLNVSVRQRGHVSSQEGINR
jgi:hypothetical protein